MEPHDEVWTRLRQVLARVFGEDAVAAARLGPHTTAEDVAGWDSVRHVELMVAVEAEFGIRFRTGELANVPDLGTLVARIAQRARASR